MFVYTVREPFGGFAKGEMLSQAQIDAYEAKGGHVDHHAVRSGAYRADDGWLWRLDCGRIGRDAGQPGIRGRD